MAKGNKVTDRIKVANQLILIWEDYPGLPGWAQCNHKVLISKRDVGDRIMEMAAGERLNQLLLALKLEEKGYQARNVGGL